MIDAAPCDGQVGSSTATSATPCWNGFCAWSGVSLLSEQKAASNLGAVHVVNWSAVTALMGSHRHEVELLGKHLHPGVRPVRIKILRQLIVPVRQAHSKSNSRAGSPARRGYVAVRASAGRSAAAVASEIIPRVFILGLPVLLLIMPYLIRPAPKCVRF